MQYNVNKKFFADLILNIMGSFMVTGVTQLIIYPILSEELDVASFGRILTLIGLCNALAVTFGSALNNSRLLNQNRYNKEANGNYKVLLKYTYFIITLISIIISIVFLKSMSFLESIIFIMVTIFTMLRGYMNVYYRMDFKYNYIFIHMLVTSVGYVVGLIIFSSIKSWPIVFLTGELFAFIFAYFTTNFKNEKGIKNSAYKNIRNQYVQLSISNSISNLMTYLDRFIINPILGASNVSIYFISSVIGKTIGIVLQPLASIVLTYISKSDNTNSKKIFKTMAFLVLIFGIGTFIITIPITPIAIRILYSDSYSLAEPYFNLANLASIIMIMGSLIQPVVLKFCPLWWQSIIQISYMTIYIVFGVILMLSNGLYGFCIIAIIANIVRLTLLITIGYYYIFLKNNKEVN